MTKTTRSDGHPTLLRRRLQLAMGASLLLALATAGCLEPADDRARIDADLGHAEGGGASVEVDHGLAGIRAIGPTELTLWAKAPLVTAKLRAGFVAAPVTVTVENALSDLALQVQSHDGYPLTVLPLPSERDTVRRWSLDLSAGQEVTLSFAPPDLEQRDGWRFVVYGDVQERIDQVQDIYRLMAAEPDVRFAVFTGDLTKRGDPEQLARFETEMFTLPFPVYATLGNHELGTQDDMFHRRFGRGSYHFAFRGVAFTLLDSASATLSPLVYDWLDGWLDQAADGMHLVMMHIPPLDPFGLRGGSFASRTEAAGLLARLAAGRVDATFYGHIHSYYEFSNAGIPAFISGGGGSYPERFDGIGRHFLVVDVTPTEQRLSSRVVRVDP